MRHIYQLAGAAFLVLAAFAAAAGVLLFFVGRAFAANIAPWEGQVGLVFFGIVALALYGAARWCGRHADAAAEQASAPGTRSNQPGRTRTTSP